MVKLFISIFKYIMSCDLYRPDIKLDPPTHPLNQLISGMPLILIYYVFIRVDWKSY